MLLREAAGGFAAHKVDAWLDYGTLLGAVREHDIIMHENDVDLGIMSNDCDSLVNTKKQHTCTSRVSLVKPTRLLHSDVSQHLTATPTYTPVTLICHFSVCVAGDGLLREHGARGPASIQSIECGAVQGACSLGSPDTPLGIFESIHPHAMSPHIRPAVQILHRRVLVRRGVCGARSKVGCKRSNFASSGLSF